MPARRWRLRNLHLFYKKNTLEDSSDGRGFIRLKASSMPAPRFNFPVSALRSLAVIGALAGLFATVHAATPVAWFKADSIAVANGAAVGLWADSSRNGHVAQAGTGVPTYSATGMNGFPSVHFNGSQTMVFPRPVQDDFSIIVLFKTADGSGTAVNFYSGAALVSGEQPGVVNDFALSILKSGSVLAGTGNPDVTLASNTGYDNGNAHIATFTRIRSTGALQLYVDRAVRATGTGGTQSCNVFQQLCIGAHPGPVGPFINGDIAEIIVFEGSLSASEALAQEEALRGKYGLANGTPPVAPINVTAAGAHVTWSESTGARTYKVLRAASAAGPFTMIAQNLVAGEYTDPSPVPNQANYYQIVAVNAIGSSAASATAEGGTLVLPASGPVLINEIHYNGLNNSVHSDFIELYNFSAAPADLSGWLLSGGIDFTFPAGTVIPAGGYLVIAEDPATVQALWGATALGPYVKTLSSDGETLRLRNPANAIICEVAYSSGFPWPCAANGGGPSAELVNPTLDPAKGSSWRSSVTSSTALTGEVASPGAQNYQFRLNPPPNIEEVVHAPQQPASATPITVTARINDANGLAGAQLSYQVVTPGNHIPAYLPTPIVNHLIDTSVARTPNPAFELAANWTSITMRDDGTGGDAVAGDGVFTAVIPGQAHRSLVRYRITATDTLGVATRAPFADDASKNFAVFVYNGVPDYQGVAASTLTTLPVYHILTRKADYDQCVAYNSADQLTGNTPAWTCENWEATIVFDGIVYDHITYRLHGGNGRYYFTSKRGFRFFFNKGREFQNRDNDGDPSPTTWSSLTTENCWENRGTLTYSLNEVVNFHLWEQLGIPSPRSNWGHFRTVTTAVEQADAYHGDFWGLIMIHEDYDRRFLDSHNMEKGNLYKLTRDTVDGASQQRYQAPDTVADGSDHHNIYANLTVDKDDAFVNRYVNLGKWSTYHALCQAIRHYDYWPTGDNNGCYYFQPDFTDQTTTDHYGKLSIMPSDVDATWGPTWNEGKDPVYAAIFDNPGNPGLYPTYFNAVRELRDLLWQPEQINAVIDQYAAVIAPFVAADSLRWKGGPNEAGNYNGLGGAGAVSLANLVSDMKNFAWAGGSWPGGDVAAGGRAAFLDTLQLGVANSEGAAMPATPTLTYQGPVGYPTNLLTFGSSNFSDPQGAADFAAIQWRVAEVTDPGAPAYDPAKKFKLEWNADYDTGALPAFAGSFSFPGTVCKAGHAYRARVRHQDLSGRWSHWSAPLQFTANTGTDALQVVPSEFLYKPPLPTDAEIAAGFTDRDMFEFFEIRNVGSVAADLSGCKFTKGVTFTFPAASILAPGASTLVVSNAVAFAIRHGTGRPVAGTYTGNLSNSGERVQFTTAAGTPLFDFTYLDAAPWPVEANTGGYSLVLINPASRPDPKLAGNWRASRRPGGAPGVADDISFAEWALPNSVGSPAADDDHDGLPNAVEYALLTDPRLPTAPPAGEYRLLTVAGVTANYLTTTFRCRVDASDIVYHVEYSSDCRTWNESAVLDNVIDLYDGTLTETWRAPTAAGVARGFLRIGISGTALQPAP